MLKFNNSIVPNKVRIGWHFSSNKYAYRDVYSALKSTDNQTTLYNRYSVYILNMSISCEVDD